MSFSSSWISTSRLHSLWCLQIVLRLVAWSCLSYESMLNPSILSFRSWQSSDNKNWETWNWASRGISEHLTITEVGLGTMAEKEASGSSVGNFSVSSWWWWWRLLLQDCIGQWERPWQRRCGWPCQQLYHRHRWRIMPRNLLSMGTGGKLNGSVLGWGENDCS